jgi:outer membrane receptor protein involved in Fe transport
MFQGTIGNDIYDATRRVDAVASNLPSWMLGRWTGEGTSYRIPRYVRGDSRNWKSSDLLVYDGDYMRLKNLVISYTFPHQMTRKIGMENLKVYASAENLLTFTKYHGYDPEISSGGTSLGIDYGVYPQPRTFSVGVNVQF